MKFGLLLVEILIVLTGCFSKENKSDILASSPTLTPTLSLDFKLSFKEQEVYNNFQKDLNEQYLKELEPISIAKLYVQASLDYNNDVVYALYTDKKDTFNGQKKKMKKFLIQIEE